MSRVSQENKKARKQKNKIFRNFGCAFISLFLYFFISSTPAKAANINFSLETWLNPASSIATKAILVKNEEMRLVTDGDGNPSCQIHNGDDWQTAAVSSSALSLGAWQNVACTYDGSNIKVYIDGVLKDTEEETADVNNTANGMQVGNDAGATYGKFQGQTDSVRIYNRALSANEIKAHYDLGNLAQDGGIEDGDAGEWAQASEGAELVTNGTFNSDLSDWDLTEGGSGGTITWDAGTIKFTEGSVSENMYASQDIATTAGKMYKVILGSVAGSSGYHYIKVGTSQNGSQLYNSGEFSATTNKTAYFTASGATTWITLHFAGGSTIVSNWDNVSIVSAQTASAESGTVADEDGLVGGWNFEETSSPAIDVSGNGNSGTWTGGATYSNSGRFGKAISLNESSSDFISMGEPASLDQNFNSLTLESWFKWNGDNDGDALIAKGTIWYLAVNSNTSVRLRHINVGDGITDVTVSSLGTSWHHLVSTFDGSNTRLYLDGIYQGGEAASGTLGTNNDNVRIGYNDSSTWYWNGLIDSPRIYNRALSASEIAAQYSLGRNKFDNYSAKIKLAADDSNSYLDESLTNGSDYLLSYWYKMGEDNINPINFTVSGSGAIAAEQNLMATSASGLVGAWNFEEGGSSATTADLSGSGNTGTVTNAGGGTNATIAAMWTDGINGKYGRSLEFDGTDDYVDCGSGSSLDDLTSALSLSAWIKTASTQAYVIAKKDNNDGQYAMYVGSGNTLSFVYWDGAQNVELPLSSGAVNDNTWKHLAITINGTSAAGYVNGVAGLTGALNASLTSYPSVPVYIGARKNGVIPDYLLTGQIDSVRIYNRALTASEIYDSYKSTNWRQYELSFEADAGDGSGNTLFKFIQNGTTSGNSIVYTDNFRVDKNLVNKGGMEGTFTDGVAAGWAEAGSTATSSESADEHTGAKAQAVLAGDTSNNVAQTVTVETGKYYTFSAYGKVDSGNATVELSGAASATHNFSISQFLNFSYTFKATSTSAFLVIELYADATKTGTFDDISLIELDSYTAPTTATTTTPSTATNSYGAGRWGESSGALLVDGADTLTYPTANNIYADEGTVAFWVKPALNYDKYGENKYLWTLDDGTNQVARIYYNYSDHKFYFEVYDGSNWTSVQAVSSAQSFTRNTWIHIASYWSDRSNKSYLFVNGAQDGYSTNYWYAQTLPTNMYFGSDYDGTNTGEMYFDDLRIYDHALTAEDIKRLYGSASDPSASTLRVEIPFTSGGTGINGTGLYSLTGSFTAAFGYHTTKPTTEYGLGIFGSDNLQYGRGTQVDGIVYESFDGYQGTIKTWVKPAFDGTDATTNVILQNGDASNYIKLYYSSGNLYFDAYTSSTTYRAYKSVSDWTAGTWYHIAAVWSNQNAVTTGATTYLTDLYINGSNSSVTHSGDTFGTNFWTAFAPSATTFVGEDKDAANQFNGVIGGLTIDNRPWSGDTILADYNSGSGTSSAVSSETRLAILGPNESTRTTNMVYWPIVESTGNLITDGNMEDGDVAEWSESANAYSSAESGIITPEDGLVGGWNYESNLTDASGNSKNGVSHTNPSCPTGYVFVPGNSTFNTSDFCVMKYEAKYDKSGDLDGDDATTCIADSGDGWDWRDAGCATGGTTVSTANGSPIVHITHTQALTACPVGDHLITNDEWMTIARDAEQVNANWTNGTVGSGCLFAGNNGDATCGYNGSDPEKGTGRNARAKFILSSGEEIYDIAGNVWEHVKVDASDTLINNHPTDGGAAGWRWIEFTAITGYGDLSYNQIRPSDASWNATQGMGRLYTYNGVFNGRVLFRGGRWNGVTDAGAFTLYLGWSTAGRDFMVGFRCSR